MIELGERGDAEPRGILLAGSEEVEGALRGGLVRARGLEPLVGDPGVVAGEVSEDAYAACVRRVGEPPQCRVAAKERVDGVEGVGVITVVGAPGEERREVDDVGT